MVRKLLLIDDDEEMCDELSQILRDEGYSVTTAFNGADGSNFLLRNDYDLVMLDIKMPGLNGVEVLKTAKEKNVRAKIVVVTGSFMINKLLKEGNIPQEGEDRTILKLADCLMSKPFQIQDLLTRIKELIG